jgi:hypothetical protein
MKSIGIGCGMVVAAFGLCMAGMVFEMMTNAAFELLDFFLTVVVGI